MPRNSSGVYSLPVAAFTSGTTILSASMNSNLSDIATALTQSLASTGVTPMTGPILGASGTVAAPGYTFNSYPTTGFYSAGANQIGWASAGVAGALFGSDLSVLWYGAHTFPSGKTVTFNGPVALGTSAPQFFQCYFQYTNATTCTLVPRLGNIVSINGAAGILAAAGTTVTTSNVNGGGAAGASTFYYIYAYVSGTSILIEGSTTGYTTSSTYGTPNKTGDATRLLVGAVYTTGASQFADTDGQVQVISYWNRKPKRSWVASGGNVNISSVYPTFVEVTTGAAAGRNFFLSWPEDTVQAFGHGALQLVTGLGNTYYGLANNKSGFGTPDISALATNPSASSQVIPTHISYAFGPNYFNSYALANYVQSAGAVSAGTGTFLGNTLAAGSTYTGVIVLG